MINQTSNFGSLFGACETKEDIKGHEKDNPQ